MDEPLWQLERVGVGSGTLPRLEEVTVTIRRGVTAVVGPSGAGKTSLVNLLVGFEKPDRGRISAELAGRGGTLPLFWVPQDGGLWPHMTVLEHLRTAAPADTAREDLLHLLSDFDIKDKADAYPDELSGGERARLSTARALATRAAVLVMDEPLASVDPARQGKYWDAIRRHLDGNAASLVYATHSAKTVLREAERVVCLRDGRVLYEGEVDELYWRPATPELMTCLGEGNWLRPEEIRIWFEAQKDCPVGLDGEGRCYRPEQIEIRKTGGSPIVVRRSLFQGEIAEAELENEENGIVRRFLHRPASDRLRPGDRVIVKVLMALFLCFIVGCGSPEEGTIQVRRITHWPVPPDRASIPAPRAVASGSNDEVIVLDTAGRVLVYDGSGKIRRQWRMPEYEVGKPEGVCLLKDGRVAVADTHYHRVVFFDSEGKVVGMLGREGRGPGDFIYPVSIAQDDKENIYVCEYGSNDRVQKFTREGGYLLSFGSFGTGMGQFQRPSGMLWHKGRVIVADAINNRIQVFGDDGRYIGMLEAPARPLRLHFPYDIALDGDGDLYIIEYGAGRITEVGLDGGLLGRYGKPGSGEGEFRTPWGIAIDSKGRLLVADTGNRRIAVIEQADRK